MFNGFTMKQRMKLIQDCRECEDFIWDFDLGRFKCVIRDDKMIEDLHIIPDWCPLLETPKINSLDNLY